MSDITESVINAVVQRVKSQVTDVSNRVYFEPPQNTVFPFIQFNFSVDALPIKDIDAHNYTITFNTYVQRGGSGALLVATRIGKKIYDALNNYDISIVTGDAYACFFDNLATAFTAEDGVVVYVSRYKVLTTN